MLKIRGIQTLACRTHTHLQHMLNIIVSDAKCSFNACIVSMLMSSFKLFNISKIIQIMVHNTTRQTQTHTQTYSQAHWMSVLKVCHLHATLCCTSTMRREAMSHNRDYLCVFCSGFFETHPFPSIVLNSHAYELLSAWNRGETVQTAWHLIWVWKKKQLQLLLDSIMWMSFLHWIFLEIYITGETAEP